MKSLLLIFFLLTSFFSFAQQSYWTIYNTSNSGLPCDTIFSIAIDKDGNKWIGTGSISGNGGLAMFDGVNWVTYNTKNSGLPNDQINVLAIDINNNIWIGTDSGLTKFDGAIWTTYNAANSGLKSYPRSIAFDSKGNVWIGTYEGLTKFDGTTWTSYPFSSQGMINSLVIDADDNKWIGAGDYFHQQGCLAKFDGTNWTTYNSANSGMPDSYIHSISIDSTGKIWIGTIYTGLAKFDGTNWTTYLSNLGAIWSISIDTTGNKWLGVFGGGLVKFDGTNSITYKTSNSDLPNNVIRTIAIDTKGNKWIGTEGGLAVFNDGIGLSVENDSQLIKNLILFPIPTSNNITISNSSFSKEMKICIFNSHGSKVMETVGTGIETQINVQTLTSGLYIVQVQTVDGIESKLLVIEK